MSNLKRYQVLREMQINDFLETAKAAGVSIDRKHHIRYYYAMQVAVQESNNKKTPEQLVGEKDLLGIY